MELAAFIRSNEDVIVAEWEAFAHAHVHSAAHMDRSALRDHIKGLLRFIADDRKREERLIAPPKPTLPFGLREASIRSR
jgi:hypothetical protein